jgi:hypothetical protein
MPIEMLIFKIDDALPEFIRNAVLRGKTPLSVVGNFCGKQFAVSAFDNRSVR